MIIGNEDAQSLLRGHMGLSTNLLVYGPPGVGKYSLLTHELETRQIPFSLILPDSNISEVRESISHRETLVVRDAHRLSETAQDAFLKVMETDVRVMFVCDDIGLISDALLSRFQARVAFKPIDRDLFPDLSHSEYGLSDGSFVDAEYVRRNPDLIKWLLLLVAAKPVDLLLTPIPSFLKPADKDESFLRVISRGLLIAGRHRRQASHFAALASDVLKTPSMNLGLHIHTMAVGLLNDSLD